MSAIHPTCAVIVIGDEVLGGRVEEVNASYLCRRLTDLGVSVRRVLIVPDEVDYIAREVADCAKSFTYVLTSGGVGPTHDDVTMEGVARAFGVALHCHAEAETVIREFYGEHMADSALTMAELPEGAELVMGEGIRFPVVRVENVWVFPGSPHLMKSKFEAVREHFAGTPFVSAQVAVNVDEPEIADLLRAVQGRHGDVAIGSYPQEPGARVKLVITLKGRKEKRVKAVRAELLEQLEAQGVVPTV